MKGAQKSQNQQQSQQQSQVQTPKTNMLSRLNNRLRSQNSDTSGILSQNDPNFSEMNQSMRLGANLNNQGQGVIGNEGMGNDLNMLEISQISRISNQSSMVTLNQHLTTNNEKVKSTPRNDGIKHNQQSSSNSIASIQNLLVVSKKENISNQQIPQNQLQQHVEVQQEQILIQDYKQKQNQQEPPLNQSLVSQSQLSHQQLPQLQQQLLQEQKLPVNNSNNANSNKRMTFQPVTIPQNMMPTKQNITPTGSQNVNKEKNVTNYQQNSNKQQQSSKSKNNNTITQNQQHRESLKDDANFSNYVEGMNNTGNTTGRAASGQNSQSIISNDNLEKISQQSNVKKNLLPPSNKSSAATNKLQQTTKSVIIPSKILMNSTQQKIQSRNNNSVTPNINNQKAQTTGISDKEQNFNQSQIIHQNDCNQSEQLLQIRTDSQLSQISPNKQKQYQSVILKSQASTDRRRSSLTNKEFNDSSSINQQSMISSSNTNNNKSTPQKKFKMVGISTIAANQINKMSAHGSKDTKASNINSKANFNQTQKIPSTVTSSIKNTSNNQTTNNNQRQSLLLTQPLLKSQKSIGGTNSSSQNTNISKKPVFGARQDRRDSIESFNDEDQSIKQDPLNKTQKLPAKTDKKLFIQTDITTQSKQQLNTQKSEQIVLKTLPNNQSSSNTQETEVSQNDLNQQKKQVVEQIPAKRISKVVILPPSTNSLILKSNESQIQSARVNNLNQKTPQIKLEQIKNEKLTTQEKKRQTMSTLDNNSIKNQLIQPSQQSSPLKKQKTGGVFGARTQRSLSQDSEEDDNLNKNQKSNQPVQNAINTKPQQQNLSQKPQNNVKSILKNKEVKQESQVEKQQLMNCSPSVSSLKSFLNLEQQTELQSDNVKKESTPQKMKQVVIVRPESMIKTPIEQKQNLITPTSKYTLNHRLKSASQVVQLSNLAQQKMTGIKPRDQSRNIVIQSNDQKSSSTLGSEIQEKEPIKQEVQNKTQVQSLDQSQKLALEQSTSNKAILEEQKVQIQSNQIVEGKKENVSSAVQNKPKIIISQMKTPVVEKSTSLIPIDQKIEAFQAEKQKNLKLSNLEIIASQQQKINQATEHLEYIKLIKEMNQYLKESNKVLLSDGSASNSPDHTIQYEEFRNLLKHLNFLDTAKVNPVQDYLIGQMWVKELQSCDTCHIRNILTLLSGILKIPTGEILIPIDQIGQYKQGMSIMMFSNNGFGLFKNFEDVETCSKTYSMISRQREELIVQKKNQQSEEKRKKIQYNTNVGGNITLEVGLLDNNKTSKEKLMISHISQRSQDSSNSLQFSDLERHSHRSRVVLLPSKISEEEIKLELVNKSLNGSNQKNSPLLDLTKSEHPLTSRDLPSNEQKGFKSQTPSMRNTYNSGNLLTVVNNKQHQRGQQKFGKIVEEITPIRRESGETPRIQVGRLDSNTRNTEMLSKSIAQNNSSDNIRSTLNFPANIKKLNNGKVTFTQAPYSIKGKKKVIFDLSSPDQYLNQIEQLPINPKFDSKQKMPVDEDSDKSKFGKLSDGSKLSEMIKSVGAKISDDSDRNKRPLLFMDVKLGPQKGTQKLIVYENDSPRYLAKKFAELHDLKEKVIVQLADMIERKIDEALESRKHVHVRSKSPEIRSREPSPTDMTMRVVKRTHGVKVKSNTHGEVKIKREEDDEEEW